MPRVECECGSAVPSPERAGGGMRPWIALAAVVFAGCAAREPVVMHGEPRVVSDEWRLEAKSWPLADGGVGLEVTRVHREVLEQASWVEGAAQESPGAGRAQVASADWVFLLDPRFWYAAVVGTGYIIHAVVEFVQFAVALVNHAVNRDGAPPPERNLTRWSRSSRQRSPEAVLSTALPSGRRFLDGAPAESLGLTLGDPAVPPKWVEIRLGPQPEDGYRLDAATVRKLGGPGTRLVIRDGDFATSVALGSGR